MYGFGKSNMSFAIIQQILEGEWGMVNIHYIQSLEKPYYYFCGKSMGCSNAESKVWVALYLHKSYSNLMHFPPVECELLCASFNTNWVF